LEKSLYEINPKGHTKGTVMLEICDICGIEIHRSVALGDYDNDISMLRAAGVGVAVGNASENAKAAADRITVTNEEHAIARVISEIESGEISFT
jgi:hydroxymethylpyrimidine pyrophosphatase-like HAD family hydrolase